MYQMKKIAFGYVFAFLLNYTIKFSGRSKPESYARRPTALSTI